VSEVLHWCNYFQTNKKQTNKKLLEASFQETGTDIGFFFLKESLLREERERLRKKTEDTTLVNNLEWVPVRSRAKTAKTKA